MKQNRMLKYFGLSLCSLFILLLYGGVVQAMDLPKVIDKTNCSKYKDLLIPALYRAVERGDFILPTGNLPFSYKHDPRFLAGGKKNAGKFDVNQSGDLIEKNTGKIPKYNIYGYPFPQIDLNDPNVAAKIMWNYQFQKYRIMSYDKVQGGMAWINEAGVERGLGGGPGTRLYFQGREPGQELKNPENYLSMAIDTILSPMSMKGTNSMAYDYFDERDITVFAYVPVIRRVRQTGGATRSDPYMGSDTWMDMEYMWGGKNRAMKWRLLEEKTILVPFTSLKKDILEEDANGSVHQHPVAIKWGYNTPGWEGAKWAPTSVTWVPRQVWIIEQIPKDPYYNWGVHTNYVDKDTYVIWFKEVYEKAGDFRTWALYYLHFGEAPSGHNTVGDYDCTQAIDEKARHSTIVFRELYPNAKLFLPASIVSLDNFSMNSFIGSSK